MVYSVNYPVEMNISTASTEINTLSGYLISTRELEDAWKNAARDYTNLYSFTSGTLSLITINSSGGSPLFTKSFSYTSGYLSQIVTTRISDSATLTKNLVFVSGSLYSTTVTESL